MTAPFDFQALVARAHADDPDAALAEALEPYGEQARIYNRERSGGFCCKD